MMYWTINEMQQAPNAWKEGTVKNLEIHKIFTVRCSKKLNQYLSHGVYNYNERKKICNFYFACEF